MKEFKRNPRTGRLEVWENGKKTGEIESMGDDIMRQKPKQPSKKTPKKKGK